MRIDGLTAGALVAVLVRGGFILQRIGAAGLAIGVVLLPACFLSRHFIGPQAGELALSVKYSGVAAASAGVVALLARDGVRVCAQRPLVLLGRISYGVYVYHAILLWFMTDRLSHVHPTAAFLVILAATIFVSYMSWTLIESPFIRVARVNHSVAGVVEPRSLACRQEPIPERPLI